MPSKMEIVVAAVALAICFCHTARALEMNMLEYHCQEGSHLANTNAEQASDEVYDFLRDHAADPGYNAMKVAKIGDDTYYGHAACDGKISQDECTRCVGAAYDFTIYRCTFSNGAQVKFGSCRFRVENYPFDPKW